MVKKFITTNIFIINRKMHVKQLWTNKFVNSNGQWLLVGSALLNLVKVLLELRMIKYAVPQALTAYKLSYKYAS